MGALSRTWFDLSSYPEGDNTGIAVPVLELEGVHDVLGRLQAGGGVDRPQRRGDLLAIPIGAVADRRPDQVDRTGLHDRLRPDGFYGLWEALEAVTAAEDGVTIVFGAKQTLRDRAACRGCSAERSRS